MPFFSFAKTLVIPDVAAASVSAELHVADTGNGIAISASGVIDLRVSEGSPVTVVAAAKISLGNGLLGGNDFIFLGGRIEAVHGDIVAAHLQGLLVAPSSFKFLDPASGPVSASADVKEQLMIDGDAADPDTLVAAEPGEAPYGGAVDDAAVPQGAPDSGYADALIG